MTVAAPSKVFADRIGRIEVSATMAVAAEAAKLRAQGANLVDFGAGEPHFPTPRHIKDAAIAAIEANFTRYTVVPGIPDVRKAIVERHACDFGSDYSIDEAIFTTGGKLALFNTIQVLVDHGDEVILPVPYWVSFKDIIQYAGGKVVFLETSEAESFRITAAAIEKAITPRTKAIILNSPSNPAGSVVSAEDLERIVQLAHERGIYLLLDECYVYLNYAGKPVSARLVHLGQGAPGHPWLAFQDLLHDRLARGLRAGGQASSGQPQQASVAVHLKRNQHRAEGRHRRPLRSAGLRGASSAPNSSNCATTCWPNWPRFPASPAPNPKARSTSTPTSPPSWAAKGGIRTATELATRLLHEAHVVTVPGEAFGTGEHIRISYPVTRQNIDEGTRRMGEFLSRLALERTASGLDSHNVNVSAP